MDVVQRSVKDLVPYAKNAKKHDQRQVANVAESIRQYGFVQPVVVDRDGVIVIGHCRVLAAKKLGMAEVPCVCVDDLTPEQVNALRLVDNKTNESAWDLDLLAESMKEADLDGFDLEWGVAEEYDIVQSEDNPPPEMPDELYVNVGDVYSLGRHRLMCGDSTDKSSVAQLLDGQKADMLLTDPPYNVSYVGKTHEKLKIQNDSMEDSAFLAFLTDAFSAADEVLKPGAAFYIWHAGSEGGNFCSACKSCGWKVRQVLIWNKNSIVMGRQDYQWKHEPCLYGWKNGASHYYAGDRKQSTVIDWAKPTKSQDHPTMKPVGLFEYQILNSTRPGEAVLDIFSGSGTTLMACEHSGRTAYAMEIDPRYAQATILRWETITGEKAVKL